MKKIYYLLCLTILAFTAACTHEEKDLFDDSSANRADATINANVEILAGASNGWLMEYFPASLQEYGGYTILLSFDKEGVVKVASEVANATDITTSFYSVGQSAGTVLSFDTYNDIFHFFSDPSDPSGVGGTGYGLEGDYDFLILEATPEQVLLKGKKAGGVARLTPVQGDWSSLITDIQEAASLYDSFRGYTYTVNGIEAIAKRTNRLLTFTYTTESGEIVTEKVPYRVVPSGLVFYKPITIGGVEVYSVDYSPIDGEHAFVDTAGSGATLVILPPTLSELFLEREWYMAYSGFTPAGYWGIFKLLFMKSALGDKTLNWICLTPYEPGYAAMYFDVSGEYGLVTFGWESVSDNEVYIALEGRCNTTGLNYWNAGFQYLGAPFNKKTFSIEADSEVDPTVVVLTDVASPTTKITLTTEPVLDPLNN